MRFTFSCENEIFTCASPDRSLTFVRPARFQNLQSVCKDGAALFDGYSMAFRGEGFGELSGEAFFNDHKAISIRAYVEDPASQGVDLFADGDVTVESLYVAQMGSIFD